MDKHGLGYGMVLSLYLRHFYSKIFSARDGICELFNPGSGVAGEDFV